MLFNVSYQPDVSLLLYFLVLPSLLLPTSFRSDSNHTFQRYYSFGCDETSSTVICEESDCDINDGDDDDNDLSNLEGAAPTAECRRLARGEALERSFASGLYPQLSGCERPSQLLDPQYYHKLAG